MKLENNKSKKRLIIIIIAILLVLALAVGGLIIYNNYFADKPVNSDGVVGTVVTDWDHGIKDTPSSSEDGGVQIPGYNAATMNYGDKSLHISIGNPKDNKCGFYATVKLEDGTILYKSDFLAPGSGLTDIPISISLEKGEHKAMVLYQCVTLDNAHTPLNAAESAFTLIVK